MPTAQIRHMNPRIQPQQEIKKPWNCPKCANHNYALRDKCNRCGLQRPAGQVSASSFSGRRPGDWTCGNCNFHNFASRALCYKCDNQKPPGAMRPGDWICECKSHNYVNRESCFRCAKPRGAKEPLILKRPQPPPPRSQLSAENSVKDVVQTPNDDNQSLRSKGVCFDYNQGRCLRGQDCQYSHTPEGASSDSWNVGAKVVPVNDSTTNSSEKIPLESDNSANSGVKGSLESDDTANSGAKRRREIDGTTDLPPASKPKLQNLTQTPKGAEGQNPISNVNNNPEVEAYKKVMQAAALKFFGGAEK